MSKFLLLVLVLLSVSACGVKPDEVTLPEEVESGEFPRTYPSIGTDPPPHVAPR